MKPIHELSAEEFATLLRRAATLPDAPPALVRDAIGLWPAARPPAWQAAAAAAVRQIAAVLGFDSWGAAPAALGMREVPSAARQMVFSAMGRDIDLRIAPVNDRFVVSGQILGPDEAGTVLLAVVAGSGAELAQIAALDALGEFRFEAAAAGSYVVTVCVGSDEIVLPAIEVGDRSR